LIILTFDKIGHLSTYQLLVSGLVLCQWTVNCCMLQCQWSLGPFALIINKINRTSPKYGQDEQLTK